MSGKTYIEKRNLLKTLPEQAIIPVKIRGVENDSSFNELEDGYILYQNFPSNRYQTDFAPTITDETNGIFTITNFIIDSVGAVVTFSFAGRFDLAAGETSGTCKFDLPAAFQPTANWASQTDVNVALSRTNDIFTAESKLTSDDSGTKLIAAELASTTPADSIRFSAVGRYNKNN
jgi:hypothetical protein